MDLKWKISAVFQPRASDIVYRFDILNMNDCLGLVSYKENRSG